MKFASIADVRAKLGSRAADQAEKKLSADALQRVAARSSNVPKKYRNARCEVNGKQFDSKLEAKVYARLVTEYGEKNVIRQVSIPIGAKRVRPDFLVIEEIHEDGRFTCFLADAKGFLTREAASKYNHLEDAHGLKVELIKK